MVQCRQQFIPSTSSSLVPLWRINLSTRPIISASSKFAAKSQHSPLRSQRPAVTDTRGPKALHVVGRERAPHTGEQELSTWSASRAKRIFDCACVLIALPVLIPVFLLVAFAVRVTSRGPVMFLQKRMGCHNQPFTIFKFRTMTHVKGGSHNAVTTTENQEFTPIGRFLRRWKLDELPQVLNVLSGEMSLVGPRPKLLEHQIAELCCRPGITGPATIAFAREEEILARVPDHHLDDYYAEVVLPVKQQLDAEYMACATFGSDLKLIIESALRRWDPAVVDQLLNAALAEEEESLRTSNTQIPAIVSITVKAMDGHVPVETSKRLSEA